MYGPAGWAHTAGIPKLGAKLKPARIGIVAKEQTKKPKFNKADEANMRRTGVR